MKIDSSPPKDYGVVTQEASIYKGLLWVLIAVALVFALYESLPSMARHVPWRYEQKLFDSVGLFPDQQQCVRNPDAVHALKLLLHKIYPVYPNDMEFPIEVTVIRGKDVNAFAFLAGRIFVLDGLIQQADSSEELAAVLSHEIEHVKRRHITQAMIQRLLLYSGIQAAFPHSNHGSLAGLLDFAAKLQFSRYQEEEADDGALERLRTARVSSAGFKTFFSRRSSPSRMAVLLSDHPSDESRLQKVNALPDYPAAPVLTDADWRSLKKICQ